MTHVLDHTRAPAGTADVLRELAGIPAGGAVDTLRDLRPAARENAQLAYRLLLAPDDDGEVSVLDRLAVAVFVAALHRDERAVAHYRRALLAAGGSDALAATLVAEAGSAGALGPVGTYREPGLATESVPAPAYRVVAREVLGERLAAAVEHARLLVLHPRDARPAALERLVAAGWTANGTVTLSQLVAFLAYQLRAAAGLSVLHATPGGPR
ncbi:CMD domain protein, Avi_7170 family [Georgenia satyanarayanai]|uniref:CMD domain protein, Avi_7170 family n=1 Tax=Georgenia satyanarayanai TaxID=860221 RepID=A0A2Y9A755_9MICO|nr:CMD domain protein [Georgenia satyanarayanai]PYG00072.1 CMD domain protein [Georgenia satyanarayanai]SSA40095.1 CMD domain protein, Avi_7170 family [Georgenia satyanarayanai]